MQARIHTLYEKATENYNSNHYYQAYSQFQSLLKMVTNKKSDSSSPFYLLIANLRLLACKIHLYAIDLTEANQQLSSLQQLRNNLEISSETEELYKNIEHYFLELNILLSNLNDLRKQADYQYNHIDLIEKTLATKDGLTNDTHLIKMQMLGLGENIKKSTQVIESAIQAASTAKLIFETTRLHKTISNIQRSVISLCESQGDIYFDHADKTTNVAEKIAYFTKANQSYETALKLIDELNLKTHKEYSATTIWLDLNILKGLENLAKIDLDQPQTHINAITSYIKSKKIKKKITWLEGDSKKEAENILQTHQAFCNAPSSKKKRKHSDLENDENIEITNIPTKKFGIDNTLAPSQNLSHLLISSEQTSLELDAELEKIESMYNENIVSLPSNKSISDDLPTQSTLTTTMKASNEKIIPIVKDTTLNKDLNKDIPLYAQSTLLVFGGNTNSNPTLPPHNLAKKHFKEMMERLCRHISKTNSHHHLSKIFHALALIHKGNTASNNIPPAIISMIISLYNTSLSIDPNPEFKQQLNAFLEKTKHISKKEQKSFSNFYEAINHYLENLSSIYPQDKIPALLKAITHDLSNMAFIKQIKSPTIESIFIDGKRLIENSLPANQVRLKSNV